MDRGEQRQESSPLHTSIKDKIYVSQTNINSAYCIKKYIQNVYQMSAKDFYDEWKIQMVRQNKNYKRIKDQKYMTLQ